MTITELLKAHDLRSRATPLKSVLGDGYLYERNRSFRNIRDVYLAMGGRFTSKDIGFYDVHPFGALTAILSELQVPFRRTVPAARALRAKTPRLPVGLLIDQQIGLRRNYLLHETSHCVAELVIPNIPSISRVDHERMVLLRLLMGEAYANTASAMCCLDFQTPFDVAFYALNDYGHAFPEKKAEFFRKIIDVFGFIDGFKIILIAHLCLKCLVVKISPQKMRSIFSGIPDLRPIRSHEWRLISEMTTFMLRESHQGFLYRLLSLHTRLVGIKSPLERLIRFDFVSALLGSRECLEALNALGSLSERGTKSPHFRTYCR